MIGEVTKLFLNVWGLLPSLNSLKEFTQTLSSDLCEISPTQYSPIISIQTPLALFFLIVHNIFICSSIPQFGDIHFKQITRDGTSDSPTITTWCPLSQFDNSEDCGFAMGWVGKGNNFINLAFIDTLNHTRSKAQSREEYMYKHTTDKLTKTSFSLNSIGNAIFMSWIETETSRVKIAYSMNLRDWYQGFDVVDDNFQSNLPPAIQFSFQNQVNKNFARMLLAYVPMNTGNIRVLLFDFAYLTAENITEYENEYVAFRNSHQVIVDGEEILGWSLAPEDVEIVGETLIEERGLSGISITTIPSESQTIFVMAWITVDQRIQIINSTDGGFSWGNAITLEDTSKNRPKLLWHSSTESLVLFWQGLDKRLNSLIDISNKTQSIFSSYSKQFVGVVTDTTCSGFEASQLITNNLKASYLDSLPVFVAVWCGTDHEGTINILYWSDSTRRMQQVVSQVYYSFFDIFRRGYNELQDTLINFFQVIVFYFDAKNLGYDLSKF